MADQTAAAPRDRRVLAAYEFARDRLITLEAQGIGSVGMSAHQAKLLRELADYAYVEWAEGEPGWHIVILRLASLWPSHPNYDSEWKLP